MEEALQLDQLRAGGVEHERLEALVGRRLGVEHGGVEAGVGGVLAHRIVERRRGVHAERRQHARRGLGHPARAAEQHAAAQLARPALELDRLRQPDPLRDAARDGQLHQL